MNKELIREELRRELARRNFYEYCKYMDPNFFTEGKWHLKVIADAFQEIYEGKIKKLAVSIAPRAGKSYITSLFCSWCLGKNPKGSIMRNSYAAKLAEKFSKDIRDGFIINPKYQAIFPNTRLGKNTAVDGWTLEGVTQPSYFCAGVGGAITGFGCNMLAILDDPIKNIEDALSETVIENTWNWYTSTHLSRLETGCPEIHIATRWSKKDPIGRLTDEYSDTYIKDMRVICIPALDENGETFCSEIKTTEEYHAIRKVTDEIIWEAEFMQNPVESKGLLFPKAELNRFRMSELAGRTIDGIMGFTDVADTGSDSLSSITGRKIGNYIYITDVVFSTDGVEVTEPQVASMIIREKIDIMKIEANNGGKAYARNVRDLIKGKSKCSITSAMNMKNKETRILMAAGYIKKYFVFREDIVPGSDYDKFFREFTSYIKLGKNKHDDAADSVTGLSEMVELIVPVKKEEVKDSLPFALQTNSINSEGVYMDW